MTPDYDIEKIQITSEADCGKCDYRIGQSGSPRWFHLRNGLESCGFYAEPAATPPIADEKQARELAAVAAKEIWDWWFSVGYAVNQEHIDFFTEMLTKHFTTALQAARPIVGEDLEKGARELADFSLVAFHDNPDAVRAELATRIAAFAQAAADERDAEIERLKAGRFTAEEFQNLCHGSSETDRAAFFEGCTKYQEQLFGTSAVAELRSELDELRRRIDHVANQNPFVGGCGNE